jgi:hypothetical protein
MKSAGTILLGLLLSSCIPTVSAQPPLVANVRAEGETCDVTVEGRRVTQKQLLDIARTSPGRHGIIVFAVDTPYKCIGTAIITLQEAGLHSVEVAAWNGS